MTHQEIKQIWVQQMARDFSCKVQDVESRENIFVKRTLENGRRTFKSDRANLKVLCTQGKLIFAGEEIIMDWCEKEYKEFKGAWFSEYNNLRKLDSYLRECGYYIEDFHHFYLPLGIENLSFETREQMRTECEFCWYDTNELEQFRGDNRFTSALTFLEAAPDMLAVTAVRNEEIIGMAGASADCEKMWQIGIDVLPSARGLGVGAYLTILIKNEILKRGVVPFYGTAESHIQSQKVAVKSGFAPAWAELHTEPVEQ